MPFNKFNLSKCSEYIKIADAGSLMNYLSEEQRDAIASNFKGAGVQALTSFNQRVLPPIVRAFDAKIQEIKRDAEEKIQNPRNTEATIQAIKELSQKAISGTVDAAFQQIISSISGSEEPQAVEEEQVAGVPEADPIIEEYVTSNLVMNDQGIPEHVKTGNDFAPPSDEITDQQDKLINYVQESFDERIANLFIIEYQDSLKRKDIDEAADVDGDGDIGAEWKSRLLDSPNGSDFKKKVALHKDLTVVPRRSHGRLPQRYTIEDSFSDTSEQCLEFMGKHPEMVDLIVAGMHQMDIGEDDKRSAVGDAIMQSLSPKFALVSFMPQGSQAVKQIEDKHDGRIEFILSNPKLLEEFEKFSGLGITEAFAQSGLNSKEMSDIKKDAAYEIVSNIVISDTDKKLVKFIASLIKNNPKVIGKWIKHYANRSLKSAFFKKKKEQSIAVKGKEGDKEFEQVGEATGEQFRETSIEKKQEEIDEIHEYLKNRFGAMKALAEKIIPYIKAFGTNSRGETDHNVTAMILENLINSFGQKMEDLINNNKLFNMSEKTLLQGSDFLFRKMITDFGGGTKKKGRSPKNKVETDLIDNKEAEESVVNNFFAKTREEDIVIDDVRTRAKRGEGIDFMSKELGLTKEQIIYYLTVGKQNVATRSRIPELDEYTKIYKERARLRKKIAEYRKIKPDSDLPAIRKKMVGLILQGYKKNENDVERVEYTAGFTDKELQTIINGTTPRKVDDYIGKLENLSDDEIAAKYEEKYAFRNKFVSSTFRKRLIGDDLRYNVAAWVGEIMRLVESGEVDYEAVNDFLNFTGVHEKLLTANRWREQAKQVWKLKGYKSFEEIPEEYQIKLKQNGVDTLEPGTKKSSSEAMILLAFSRADKIIGKLWGTRQRMNKVASTSYSDIDALIRKVAGDAYREIKQYGRKLN